MSCQGAKYPLPTGQSANQTSSPSPVWVCNRKTRTLAISSDCVTGGMGVQSKACSPSWAARGAAGSDRVLDDDARETRLLWAPVREGLAHQLRALLGAFGELLGEARLPCLLARLDPGVGPGLLVVGTDVELHFLHRGRRGDAGAHSHPHRALLGALRLSPVFGPARPDEDTRRRAFVAEARRVGALHLGLDLLALVGSRLLDPRRRRAELGAHRVQVGAQLVARGGLQRDEVLRQGESADRGADHQREHHHHWPAPRFLGDRLAALALAQLLAPR